MYQMLKGLSVRVIESRVKYSWLKIRIAWHS